MKPINPLLRLLSLSCLLMTGAFINPLAMASGSDNDTLPEIISFHVSPSSIDFGSTSVITWSVKNSSAVTIDHGIGNVLPSGQLNVNPMYSTTYKLTVSNSAGVRTRYVTLYVEMAGVNNPNDVNCDPVTGRNAQVDLSWESYCLSDEYQVQIARDPAFTLIMYDSGSMRTADSMSPAFWYPPGNLEAGHTYYWRVRTTRAATGQYVLSYWSDIKSFTVKPGYAVTAGYLTVQAFVPANGCTACPVTPVSFSWSGYPNITKYRFILARDSQLQDIVVEGLTSTTSYSLSSPLEYETSYFWQVMALDPVPSDPSSVFTFHTMPAPQEIQQLEAMGAETETPAWAIAVIVIGIVLIIIVLIFAVRSRRQI